VSSAAPAGSARKNSTGLPVRRGHVSLAELREAESGFDARLLHRAWTKVDPW
jgi:hypothetical protein